MSEPEAFERAVVANPDDLAGWCAFADYLADLNDPRGEFMQIQIALEDGARSHEERNTLKKREAELLANHEREWLGELAPHLIDNDDTRPQAEYWWTRGFVTEIRAECLSYGFAQALATAPAAKLLRTLRVEGPLRRRPGFSDAKPRAPLPPGATAPTPFFELIGAPWLAGLRSFQVGEIGTDPDDGDADVRMNAYGLEHLVAQMPRIEELQLLCSGYFAAALFELPNLTNLQTLRTVGLGETYSGNVDPVPLGAIARNPALANLTHLLVHPSATGRGYLPLAQVRAVLNSPHLKSLTHLQLRLSDMGDAGANAIIESGILKRLAWLDLRNGTMTDHAARAFAGCADAKRLRRLDLSRNAVTQAGLGALTRAGINAVVKTEPNRRELDAHEARIRRQRGWHDPNEDDRREGDWE